jgi:hypothetical protein
MGAFDGVACAAVGGVVEEHLLFLSSSDPELHP